MMENYTSYTNESPIAYGFSSECVELLANSRQNIPPVIRLLNFQDIELYPHRMLIKLYGPPRLALLAIHGHEDAGFGWRQLTNGLWWYTGGK